MKTNYYSVEGNRVSLDPLYESLDDLHKDLVDEGFRITKREIRELELSTCNVLNLSRWDINGFFRIVIRKI